MRIAIVTAAAVFAYSLFIGVAAVSAWTAKKAADCRTPLYAYGWQYEAINYDQATDAELIPIRNLDKNGVVEWQCDGTPMAAGKEVVTGDPAHVSIGGWYIPAGNGSGPEGPTVVIVPGGRSNKSETLKYAERVHPDYNLVLLDNRGTGQSQSGSFAMGALEKFDVEAMIDWLASTKQPSWIAALGNSMGAATALAEAVGDGRIRALILDSMHSQVVISTGNIMETEQNVPLLPALPGTPAAWLVVAATSLTTQTDVTQADPIRTIYQPQLRDRPILLIQGTADVIDPPDQASELNFGAASRSRVSGDAPVELDYCAGATHGHVVDTCPAAWSGWVTSFLSLARQSEAR